MVMVLLSISQIYAQNVGIGQTTPTHTLHVTPLVSGMDPLRIDGLNYFGAGDTSILIFNNNTGVVKYINPFDLKQMVGSDVTAGEGLVQTGNTINASVNNGLTVDATQDKVQLGGQLTKNTTITSEDYDMIHNLNGLGDFLIQDYGNDKFAVLNNGRVTVGGTANLGAFNVTGSSYYTDDITLRDGSINAKNMVRIYDLIDDGVIDVYQDGIIANRIKGSGNSYITGGNLGINTKAPAQPLDVAGVVRLDPETHLGNEFNRKLTIDDTGDIRANELSTLAVNEAVTYEISGKIVKQGSPVTFDLPGPLFGHTIICEFDVHTTCDGSPIPTKIHFKRYYLNPHSFGYYTGNGFVTTTLGSNISFPITTTCGYYDLIFSVNTITNAITISHTSSTTSPGLYISSGKTTVFRWN